MASFQNPQHVKEKHPKQEIVPFRNAEEAWFWFIAAQEARNDGARFSAGIGRTPRPCEPIDMLRVLDRLYRQRRLLREHLLVLRHYGRRRLAPDARRIKECRAHKLWGEALERMQPALERKGIVQRTCTPANESWFQVEGMAAE